MNKILFVCTGNIYRSPMAAAFFLREVEKRDLTEQFSAESAGTWAPEGRPAAPRAVEFMARNGLDLSKHRARRIHRQLVEEAKLVLTMEQGQEEALCAEYPEYEDRIHLLSELVGHSYDIPDPMANPDIPIEETAKEIHKLIIEGFPRILWLADA